MVHVMLTLQGKWQRHSDRIWSARSWRSPLRTHGTSCPRNRQRSQTWNKLSLKSESFLDLEWVLPAVDSSNKTVRFHPDLLWEVVSQVPSSLLPRTVGHNSQDRVHWEREVHRAGALVSVRWRLGWCWTQERITFGSKLLFFFLHKTEPWLSCPPLAIVTKVKDLRFQC